MALGSQRREVIWMVLRQAGILAGLGILIGGITSLGLLLVTCAASFIPARRSASLDPLSALRTE
jgi:ABC-type antimicrobial peptide transport system permease subunit